MKELEQIFHSYHDKVFGFFVKNLSDQELARDLTQEVFLKLCEKQESLEDIYPLNRYIYMICRNMLINHLHRAAREKNYRDQLINAWEKLPIRGMCNTERTINADHCRMIIEQSLSQLPPRQKQIFNLSKQQGWSNQRIAQKLGLSPNTVKNHLHQAMKTLRATIPDIELILIILWMGWMG